MIKRYGYSLATAVLLSLYLPISSNVTAAEDSTAPDYIEHLNPELLEVIPRISQLTARPVNAEFIAQIRKMGEGRPERPLPEGWEKEDITGRGDKPQVSIYLHNTDSEAISRPAILYFHGGGYIIGSGRGGGAMLEKLAEELDALIISVDYRLAPETPFPGSLEDNYAALAWLHQNAERLKVDPARVALLGESAGGGHAAMLAIAARDRGEFPVAFQALIYPMLDDRTGSTRSTPPWQGAFVWTPQSNQFGWTSLLGVPAGSEEVPYGSVPARMEDLTRLPATWIGVGSIDLFVQEDILYAQRLMDAGVMTALDVYPGAFHGFNLFSQGKLAQQLEKDVIGALRLGLSKK